MQTAIDSLPEFIISSHSYEFADVKKITEVET